MQVLFGVDFEVEEGQIVALLGTNGAGKSTLLKAISGQVEADHGAVIFDGRDITHAPPNEIAALGIVADARRPGRVPRPDGAARTCGWPAGSTATTAPRSQAGVESVLNEFPVLRRRLDDPAADLSGGQQQMLALGMAFLSEPKLLMIDELSLGPRPGRGRAAPPDRARASATRAPPSSSSSSR